MEALIVTVFFIGLLVVAGFVLGVIALQRADENKSAGQTTTVQVVPTPTPTEPAPAPARTNARVMYVSPDGSDTNNGSETSPFLTLSQAVKQTVLPLTVIVVAPGVYENQLASDSTSANSPVILDMQPGSEVIGLGSIGFNSPYDVTILGQGTFISEQGHGFTMQNDAGKLRVEGGVLFQGLRSGIFRPQVVRNVYEIKGTGPDGQGVNVANTDAQETIIIENCGYIYSAQNDAIRLDENRETKAIVNNCYVQTDALDEHEAIAVTSTGTDSQALITDCTLRAPNKVVAAGGGVVLTNNGATTVLMNCNLKSPGPGIYSQGGATTYAYNCIVQCNPGSQAIAGGGSIGLSNVVATTDKAGSLSEIFPDINFTIQAAVYLPD